MKDRVFVILGSCYPRAGKEWETRLTKPAGPRAPRLSSDLPGVLLDYERSRRNGLSVMPQIVFVALVIHESATEGEWQRTK
jgi:hypothetical protein